MTTRRAARRTRRVRYTAADIRHVPADQVRVGDLVWYEFDFGGMMLYPVEAIVPLGDGRSWIVTPEGNVDVYHPQQVVDVVLTDGREVV